MAKSKQPVHGGRDKLEHAQTILAASDIAALKKKTKKSNTKDAIAEAVYHYLDCTGV